MSNTNLPWHCRPWESLIQRLAAKALLALRDRDEASQLSDQDRQVREDVRRLLTDAHDKAALLRLAEYAARHWLPMDPRVCEALRQLESVEGKSRTAVKFQEALPEVFETLRRRHSVQPIPLGKNHVLASDGRLVLVGKDGTVEDALAGVVLWEPGRPATSPIAAAFLGLPEWLRASESPIHAAFVGPTRPADLRDKYLISWVRRQVIRAVEKWLKIYAGTASPRDPLRNAISLDVPRTLKARITEDEDAPALKDILSAPSDGGTPLDAIIATEQARELQDRLRRLLDVATGRQRQILEGLLVHLRDGLSIVDAKRLVANALGIEPEAIKTVFARLRDRWEARSGEGGL